MATNSPDRMTTSIARSARIRVSPTTKLLEAPETSTAYAGREVLLSAAMVQSRWNQGHTVALPETGGNLHVMVIARANGDGPSLPRALLPHIAEWVQV